MIERRGGRNGDTARERTGKEDKGGGGGGMEVMGEGKVGQISREAWKEREPEGNKIIKGNREVKLTYEASLRARERERERE